MRIAEPASVQRRWWFDPDASKKNYDKPAVTGSRHLFIKREVPVVLLQAVRGLGPQGKIVNVKRGYARHFLVPKGLAVFGTWENIDQYADPALVEDPTLKARAATERGRLPFDWVSEIQLRFVRWARDDSLSSLLEPITVWEVLEQLSAEHELDLLPVNVGLPPGGIDAIGKHEVPIRMSFRNPEAAAGSYSVMVEVVSQQSLEEELRREEMQRNVEQSMRFQLPQRGGAATFLDGIDFEDEEGGEESRPDE